MPRIRIVAAGERLTIRDIRHGFSAAYLNRLAQTGHGSRFSFPNRCLCVGHPTHAVRGHIQVIDISDVHAPAPITTSTAKAANSTRRGCVAISP